MIHTAKLTVSFGARALFENVSVKFTAGNCYGLIGANGAGKSTFLKALAGDIEANEGDVIIEKNKRMAVLRQDQFAFDEYNVLDTVLMGYKALYDVYAERMALYAKGDLTEDEGMRIGALEGEFAEMDGYTAESDASTMLAELGIEEALHNKPMGSLESGEKVRVLLAQALFGDPDILLLDEPTNQLDYMTTIWLENYLLDFKNTVIVVSHDRHFLNKVCTHIADVDYGTIKVFPGNYAFWKQSTELARKQLEDKNKKDESKIQELEDFVRRFSANASKSKQATSRKKLIDKIRPEELPVSTRRAPYIHFKPNRPVGNSILELKNVSFKAEGEQVLKNVSFRLDKGDKVAILSNNSVSKTSLLDILAGVVTPDEGDTKWGETVTPSYFPKDNTSFFKDEINLLDWLGQYFETDDMPFIRGFLGRMLFSGDDIDKSVTVLSGGEKARAMFSKMMITEPNALIMDEPTDHLDLESISSLNEGLQSFNECLIVCSHDFQLLNTVCNRIIEVGPNGILDIKTSFDAFMQDKNLQERRKALYTEA